MMIREATNRHEQVIHQHDIKRATALFNQQCWLWGCDVRRTEGNLLLAYGATKYYPPAGIKGGRAYLFPQPDRHVVILWAFGMFYGSLDAGGLYLARYGFAPILVVGLDGIPLAPDKLPNGRVPVSLADQQQCNELLCMMVSWIVAYETWVMASIGRDYRDACVASWERGSYRIAAELIVSAWQQLAETLATVPNSKLQRNTQHLSGDPRIMAYQDKTITCRDCSEPFVFTAGEQEFYAQKGFTNEPTRCPACRKARKQSAGGGRGGYSGGYEGGSGGGYRSDSYGERSGYGDERRSRDDGYGDRGGRGGAGGGPREMFTVPCSEPGCNIDAVVPFKPRGDKPVYCSDCFAKQRSSRW